MKKIASFVGIAAGILSMIFGFITFGKGVGSAPDYASFGADFYTYQYRATRYAASNLRDLSEIARFAGGALLVVIGLTLICYFLVKLSETGMFSRKPAVPASSQVTVAEAPAPAPEQPAEAENEEAVPTV